MDTVDTEVAGPRGFSAPSSRPDSASVVLDQTEALRGLPRFSHEELHPREAPTGQAAFELARSFNKALNRHPDYALKLEGFFGPEPPPPVRLPYRSHRLKVFKIVKPAAASVTLSRTGTVRSLSPLSKQGSTRSLSPKSSTTRMASSKGVLARAGSSKGLLSKTSSTKRLLAGLSEPAVEVTFRPLMVKLFHLYAGDQEGLTSALNEIRLHRLASRAPEDQQGAQGDDPPSPRPVATPPRTAASSRAPATPAKGRGGLTIKTTPDDPPETVWETTPPVTNAELEQQLFEDPQPKAQVGRHNIVAVLGHSFRVQPPGNRTEMDPNQPRIFLGMVLRLCDSGSLRDRVMCDSRIAEREVMRWTEQMLAGLAHMHSLGIIHRSLNLDNVLLVYAGAFPDGMPIYNAKIGGFGAAMEVPGYEPSATEAVDPRQVKAHVKFLKEAVGRWDAHVLPPEVRSLLVPPLTDFTKYFYKEDGPVTFQYLSGMDLWATGAIAFELMTKDTAEHRHLLLAETTTAHLRSMLPPRFDEPFRDMLDKTLARHPRDRATAANLLRSLLLVDRFVFTIKAPEPPTPATPQTQRSTKRRKPGGKTPKMGRSPTMSPKTSRTKPVHTEQSKADDSSGPGKSTIEEERQRALLERVKAYHEKMWFESLSEKEQKKVIRRRQAYQESKENIKRRREVLHTAAFR
jgi:serine/threonine protein kinase